MVICYILAIELDGCAVNLLYVYIFIKQEEQGLLLRKKDSCSKQKGIIMAQLKDSKRRGHY
jgi:hypothetical protein